MGASDPTYTHFKYGEPGIFVSLVECIMMIYSFIIAISTMSAGGAGCNSASLSAQVQTIKELSDTTAGDEAIGDLAYWWDHCTKFRAEMNDADLKMVGDLLSVPHARVIAAKFIVDLYPRSRFLRHKLMLAYKDQRRREAGFRRNSIIMPPLGSSISSKMKVAIDEMEHNRIRRSD
jgi:hypothetical protein